MGRWVGCEALVALVKDARDSNLLQLIEQQLSHTTELMQGGNARLSLLMTSGRLCRCCSNAR